MKPWLLISLTAVLLSGADARDADAQDGSLDGHWLHVSLERDGKPIPLDGGSYNQLSLAGSKFRYLPVGESAPQEPYGNIRLGTTGSQDTIDFVYEKRGGPPIKGIYKLAGNTLRLCNAPQGQPRPTAFAKGMKVEVWRRLMPGERAIPVISGSQMIKIDVVPYKNTSPVFTK